MGQKFKGHSLLKEFLAKSGSTQKQVAQGIGRSEPTVSLWLSKDKRRVPDVQSAVLLEQYTNGEVPVESWLVPEPDPPPQPSP